MSAPWAIKLQIEAVQESGAPLGIGMSTKTFTLTVNSVDCELTFTPTLCGMKCCVKPFTLALSKVSKAKLISVPYTTPALMLQVEEELRVPLIYKMWVAGPEGSVAACFQEIEAARRLLIAPVVVAGSFDITTRPESSSVTFYPQDVVAKVFLQGEKLKALTLDASVPPPTKSVDLDDGAGQIVLTRYQYGVEMTHKKDGTPIASVFCQEVGGGSFGPQAQLHVVEVLQPDSSCTFKVATPGGTAGTITNFTVEVPPTTILTSPYVAEIRAGKVGSSGKTMFDSLALVAKSAKKAIKRTVSITKPGGA